MSALIWTWLPFICCWLFMPWRALPLDLHVQSEKLSDTNSRATVCRGRSSSLSGYDECSSLTHHSVVWLMCLKPVQTKDSWRNQTSSEPCSGESQQREPTLQTADGVSVAQFIKSPLVLERNAWNQCDQRRLLSFSPTFCFKVQRFTFQKLYCPLMQEMCLLLLDGS